MAKKKAIERVAEMEGYTIGSWSGFTQYCCKYCAFDTLDQKAMLEHLLNTHSSEQALARLIEFERAESLAAENEPGIKQPAVRKSRHIAAAEPAGQVNQKLDAQETYEIDLKEDQNG